MEIREVTTILYSGASITAGAFLGALRSKLFASKTENKFHYVFYVVGGLTVVSSVVFPFLYPNYFFTPFNIVSFVGLLLALIFGIALLYFTYNYLITKSIYKIAELAPIINEFSKQADKDEIRLFGGDLNFFGNTPQEMELNIQYSFLKSQAYSKVSILCEVPNDSIKKIRYGKIYNDIPNAELKFYKPQEADLKVRGRIIKVQGSTKLLMYTKHSPGRYQTLETDTSNSNGALYENIWGLTWSMAYKPEELEVAEFKGLYYGK
jgi:hypothetical protein